MSLHDFSPQSIKPFLHLTLPVYDARIPEAPVLNGTAFELLSARVLATRKKRVTK